jgi:hypothetical protein
MKHKIDRTMASLQSTDQPSDPTWRSARHLRWLVCVIVLLLFTPFSSLPQASGPRDTPEPGETICITNEFAVDIEYPNFIVSILAHLAGVNTDRLKYVEWNSRTSSPFSFLLQLTDDDEHRWFEIASDTTFPSFVKLPLENRTALAPSALSFFSKALQFFGRTETDTLRATFEYGKDTLGASVFHCSRSADTTSLVTTHSHLETWNKRTGEAYNSAEIVSVTQEGYTTFRSINIFLKKKGILLRLTSVRSSVVRTTY